MAVVGLVTLLSALNGVQPSGGFALDAKPLELSLLDNEYCMYGLRRRPPHEWCICWGKIDTRVEVLPWDCSTRAPKFVSRRKRDQNSGWKLDSFLRGLNTRNNLFPQDLLKADRKLEMPRMKLQKPKPSMLDKALTVMLKEVAESGSDDSLLATQLSFLLLPYLHSYYTDRKTSALSQALSALKSLLLDLGESKTVEELEESLFKDLGLLKRKLLTVKNSLVADLEEMLHILKDFPSRNQSGTARNDPMEVSYWDTIRRNQIAAAEDQKRRIIHQSSKVSASVLEPHDAKPGNPPVSDGIGLNMILKLGSARNYSNMARVLGKKFAEVFGIDGSPKNDWEAAPNSSVAVRIGEIQYSAAESAEKSSTVPEIQAPANLKQPELVVIDSGNPREFWSIINHSNIAEVLDKTWAKAVGLKESSTNVAELDSAPESSAVADIKGSASEGIEKSSAEPEIQASANLTQPKSVDSGNPSKLESTRNYSNVGERLGSTSAQAVGLKENLTNVSELDSALLNSVVVRIAEIQDSATGSTEKSSAEAKIQAPENLTRPEFVDSDSGRNSPTSDIESSPQVVLEDSSEFVKLHVPSLVYADSPSTESPELEDTSSNKLKTDNSQKTSISKYMKT